LVHLPGWSDSSRTRGGYQFKANADGVIVLKGDPVNPLVELERKKVKNGPSGARLWLRRQVRHGSVLFEEGSAADAIDPIRNRVVAVLLDYREPGRPAPSSPWRSASPATDPGSTRAARRRQLSADDL
jgi:hypothetical protein